MEQEVRERGRKGRRWWTGDMYRLQKQGCVVLVLIALGIIGVVILFRSPTDELQTGKSSACDNLLIAIGLQDGNFLLRLVEGSEEIASWMNDGELTSSSLCVEGFDLHDHYRERLSAVKASVVESLASLRINLGAVALNYNGKLAVEVNNKPVDKFVSVVDDKYVAFNFEKSFLGRLKTRRELPVVDVLDLAERRRVEPEGIVIVRFSGSPEDASSFLRMFLADPRLGRRVKLLVLELRSAPTYLGGARSTNQHPGGKNEVEKLRRMLLSMDDCITQVTVIEEENYVEPASEDNGLFYSVLAGHTTWTARVQPALNSWLKSVDYGRAAIFTNFAINPGSVEAKALKDHIAVVAAPAHPESEKTLTLMSSWSHLVRLRASWDLFMRQDTSLKYLILLDDDTFPFTDTFEAVLRQCMDPNALEWGGAPELVRVDNGDGPVHGEALRQANLNAGGKRCRFPNEPKEPDVPYCSTVLCPSCPSVPQGGMIVVSRALVQRLRPHIEQCERDTQDLCTRCGSQRVYFCIQEHAKEAKTLHLRGVYRTPWNGEKHTTSTEWHGYPLSLHAMKSSNPKLHHTTVASDFNELYNLALRARRRRAVDAGEPYVLIEDLHFQITCERMGYFRQGKCYSTLEPHNFWCQTSSYTWKPK